MIRFLLARFSSLLPSVAFTGVLVCFALGANATIIRVDNNPGSPGQYTSAQAAHDAATAGDTLYFTGSGIGYGNLTLTKKLYLFGPGYFLTQNPETQANLNSASLGIVTFSSGSSGSLMTGLVTSRVDLNTSNLVIKRNYMAAYQQNTVNVANNLGNILILQNYIYQSWYDSYALSIGSGGSGIDVRNNFIVNVHTAGVPYQNGVTCNSSITFANNVVFGNFSVNASQIFNNILRSGTFSGSGNTVQHNISNSTQFGALNMNQQSVSMSNVFLGGSSSDGQFQLKAGSPALDAGVGGEDIGMFGGQDPYVLSGLPAIPAIWFFNGPATGSGPAGLPIQVKVKSHN